MLLYVWLAGWELECCQPELTVGDEWGGSLYLGPAEPWWGQYANAPLPADVRDLGVVEFDGDVLRPARRETHAASVGLDDLDCRGIVRGIRGISYVYGPNERDPDDEELAQVPVAQNKPRDLRTTFDRAFTGGHEFGTYLIDLDIS